MKEYQTRKRCNNCKEFTWIFHIPIGVTVETHCGRKKLKCLHCGCEFHPVEDSDPVEDSE